MMTTINDINRYKSITVNPLLSPDQLFELYSVPSFDNQYPEVVTGKEIGSTKVAVQENDVLICKINPRINRVWVVKHNTQYPLIASSEWIVVRSPENDSNYLKWYFSSPQFKNLMVSQVTGIGGSLTRAQPKQVATYPVPLPDFPTQRRIANTLDKVSEGITLGKKMLDELDLMVKAKFVEMFGDPLTNDRKWLSFPLTKACKAILGGGTPSKSHPEYFIGMIPWVSPKDMKSAVISDSIDHITEEAIVHSTTKLVPKNSVLMVIRSGILKHTLPVAVNSVPVTINQDMKAFVPSNMITTEFLMYYFKAIESDVLAGVRGVTADNIDFKAFQQRTIVAPPLELQNRFAAFVAEVDKLKLTIQGIRDKMEMKKLALMQGFFG